MTDDKLRQKVFVKIKRIKPELSGEFLDHAIDKALVEIKATTGLSRMFLEIYLAT